MLAALLLRPGEVVSVDRLVEALWAEQPPRTAIGSLQNAVSVLRRVLTPGALVTRSPGYVLAVDPKAIDAVRFEQAVRHASGLEPAQCSEALADALALWRGPALADLADETFAKTEAARLDELRVAATEARLDADLTMGRGAELVGEIETHVSANPYRERLRGHLMLALYRSGRQAEALEAYQDARHALVEGLGIDPSPGLQELERRILRQDPTLLTAEPDPARPERAAVDPRIRKTITVLAATLDDVSHLDPELLRDRVDRFLMTIHAVAQRHGGTLDRFLGSEAVMIFGVPTSHEDDALRAMRAAVELRERISSEGDKVRVGVATGEALVGTSETAVVGDVVTVATGLRDAAQPEDILASEPTYALARDAVAADDPVRAGARGTLARRIQTVQGARGRERRLDTPFVGRQRELAVLRDALGRATAERRCVPVAVLGDAGIGKTRLAEELVASLVRGRVVEARCVAYGDGSTFRPVVDLLERATGGTTDEVLARVLPKTEEGRFAACRLARLADPAATVPRGEAYSAVRVLLEAIAGDGPLITILDDLHWAEPALLDLIDYLVERLAASVVLLCLARPDLLDERPGWAGATSRMTLVRLEPLEVEEAHALVAGLDRDALDPRVRKRIVERAGGNALHLEQLHAFVVDEGGDPELASVPATVEAVLGSRIDVLPPSVRETLERAAVAGPELTRGILVALSEEGAPVDAALLELTRRGLLHPEPGDGHDDRYRSHHALLRDVAYGRLPKATRFDLHLRAATWLERGGPGSDERVGWHLEQAHRYATELRPRDPALEQLAQAAGERLGQAGIRAAKASDIRAACNLIERAIALLPAQELRAELLCELAPQRRSMGDTEGVAIALGEALEIATALGDRSLLARARMEIAWDDAAFRTAESMASFRGVLCDGMAVFKAAEDNRALSRAWMYLSATHLYEEKHGRRARAARLAARHARRAGWPPTLAIAAQASSLVHGPTPVERALVEGERLAQEWGGSRVTRACVDLSLAELHAMNTEHQVAQELVEAAHAALLDLDERNLVRRLWSPSQMTVYRLGQNSSDVEKHLRGWCAELEDTGDAAYLSTALAWLASVLRDEEPTESDKLLARAAALASPDDLFVQALIRATEATRLAAEGGYDEGLLRVDEAAALLDPSDALNDRAQIEIARARVHELGGRGDLADAGLRHARQLYAAKGNSAALQSLERHGTRAIT